MDDLLSDKELELTRGDLAQALETRAGGHRRSKGAEDGQQEHPDVREAFERQRQRQRHPSARLPARPPNGA